MSINYFEKQNILFGREVSTPENSPAYVTGSTSNLNSVANVPMVSQEAVEAEVIGDSFKPTSTKPQNTQKHQESQKEVKYSVEQEILKQFDKLNSKYNLGLTEENCIEIISEACNKPISEVSKASVEEVQKYVNHIQETINAMIADEKENNPKISESKITLNPNEIKTQSKKYAIALSYGWDNIESLRIANSENCESVKTRLSRWAGKDITKLSPQELADVIKAYFTHYDKNCNDGTFKGFLKEGYRNLYKIIDNDGYSQAIKNLQETDFVKLLHNSSEEEFDILREAIQYLEKDSQMKAVCDMLKSFDNKEDAINYASEKLTHEELKKYETPTNECAHEITEIRRYHDKDATRAYEYAESREAHEFYNCYGKQLQELKAKIKNNPNIELTPVEKDILEYDKYLQKLRGAASIAILTNYSDFDENTTVALLEETHVNTFNISVVAGEDFLRNVILETATQIKNNIQALNVTYEQATAMMDATTRGNYSTVVADSQNGTRSTLNTHTEANSEMAQKIYTAIEKYEGEYTATEVNEIIEKVVTSKETETVRPVATSTKSATVKETERAVASEKAEKATGALGFVTKPIDQKATIESVNAKVQNLVNNSNNNLEEIKADEKPAYSPVISEVALAVRENGVEGLKSYIKENGTQKTILEILNDVENVPSYVKDLATTWYKKSNKQIDILSRASISAIKELLPVTNEEVLLNNKGKTFANYYATKLFNDKAAEVEKENKKRNLA